MVDKTIFWSVSLGLKGSEKGLLGTKNLNSGGWVLGEVGEGSSMGDEASRNDLTDELGQVRRDDGHLVGEVLEEGTAVLGELDDAVGEGGNVLHVLYSQILSHGNLGGINDGLCDILIIVDECSNVVELLIGKILLISNGKGELGVGVVVGNDLDEFWEVPRVPLTDTHGEGVDGLVESIEGSNGLDDVVVVLLHRELYLGTGVCVSKTELGALDISIVKSLQQLWCEESEASEKVTNDLGGIGSLALDGWEVGLDGSSQVLVLDTENDLLLLADFWEVELKDGAEVLGEDTLRDHVDVLKGLSGGSVGRMLAIRSSACNSSIVRVYL